MTLLSSLVFFNKYLIILLFYGAVLQINNVLAICRDPPRVDHSIIIDAKSEYETGTRLRYKCQIGYSIDGNSRITCNSDGTWTNVEFTCEGTPCQPPEKPSNGRIIGTIFTFGNLVEFVCNDGYLMYDNTGSRALTKSPSRQCTAEGSWTSYTPTCKVIECPDLGDIHDGTIDVTSKTYGSVANYRCEVGFKLNGNLKRMCGADGQWTGEEPKCDVMTCPEPMEFVGGVAELVTFNQVGNRMIYRCHDGTEVTAICKDYGGWEPGPPPCMAGTSTEPPKPPTKVPTTTPGIFIVSTDSVATPETTSSNVPVTAAITPEISTGDSITAGPEVTSDAPDIPETAPVPTVIVIPIVVGILVIACSVAGYVFWKKKKTNKHRKDPGGITKPEELLHLSNAPSQQI